jgi:hypothetical protein
VIRDVPPPPVVLLSIADVPLADLAGITWSPEFCEVDEREVQFDAHGVRIDRFDYGTLPKPCFGDADWSSPDQTDPPTIALRLIEGGAYEFGSGSRYLQAARDASDATIRARIYGVP